MNKLNIILVIKSLAGGGAEKVLTLLAHGFIKAGHSVTLITYESTKKDVYILNPNVKRIDLSEKWLKGNVVSKNISLLNSLRNNIKSSNADVVISFVHMVNIRTLISCIGLNIPIVVTEHCDPSKSSLNNTWRLIRKLAYPFSSKLIGVSEGVTDKFTWLKKRQTIYNPVEIDKVEKESNSKRLILGSMGRLTYQKGYNRLIKYFSVVAEEFPEWDLVIYGEGDLRTQLKQQIIDLKLTERIFLPGFHQNSKEALTNLELFVITSHFEGFCLVIVEAMAQKVPVISFDCPSGPAELIENNVNGSLIAADDEESMINQMRQLMLNKSERERLAEAGHTSINRFSLPEIINEWEGLFKEIIDEK